MTENATKPKRPTGLIWGGLVVTVLGVAMTRGSLGPLVGLIVALLGIGMVVAWLVRRD